MFERRRDRGVCRRGCDIFWEAVWEQAKLRYGLVTEPFKTTGPFARGFVDFHGGLGGYRGVPKRVFSFLTETFTIIIVGILATRAPAILRSGHKS